MPTRSQSRARRPIWLSKPKECALSRPLAPPDPLLEVPHAMTGTAELLTWVFSLKLVVLPLTLAHIRDRLRIRHDHQIPVCRLDAYFEQLASTPRAWIATVELQPTLRYRSPPNAPAPHCADRCFRPTHYFPSISRLPIRACAASVNAHATRFSDSSAFLGLFPLMVLIAIR